MTEITIFRFENKPVNIIKDDAGELWFNAADVCRNLELSNVTMALRVLDADEKGLKIIETLGGEQQVNCVSEPGLYKLISRSRKPEAKRFDRWVRHDVLPAIRKTGSYNVVSAIDLNDPALLRSTLINYADRVISLEAETTVLKAEKAQTAPQLAVYNKCMKLEGLFGLQQGGRLLRQKPNLFIRFLKTKWLFYQGGELIPRAQYSMAGSQIFDVKWVSQGEKNRAQSYLTPKGLEYFAKHLGVEIDTSQFMPVPNVISPSREMELH